MNHGETGEIVTPKMKKKIKQKKMSEVGEKNKDGGILTDDVENVGIDDGIVNNVDKFEKRSSKQNKEKNKFAGVEVEVEKKGKTKSKLIVVNSEDVTENATNNAEKKKKNSNQDSDTLEFEVGGGADVEVNERQKKPDEESVSKMSYQNEVESDNNGKKKRKKVTRTGTDDPSPNKSNKKVKFSDEVEVTVFHDSNTKRNWNDKEDDMVRGKRYTSEEDEIIKEAVFKYIADYDLGEEGLRMVLDSQKHHELRGCWKQIATALPYRPVKSFYERTKRLLWRLENRKWTQEEYERLLNYQKEHGNKWRAIADELGKHPVLVSETWQRIKRQRRRGRWSQKEYQQLFDLVNTDLQQKVNKEKRSMHGMLRDNISWTSISDELSTRPNAACCNKWYRQLTSPMVIQGVWTDSDDYRMVGELYKLDANCIEDVNWDHLLDERSGDLCLKRWNQMILYIGNHQRKSFSEQVEVLAQRYCPHLLEAREAWDNKPRVP